MARTRFTPVTLLHTALPTPRNSTDYSISVGEHRVLVFAEVHADIHGIKTLPPSSTSPSSSSVSPPSKGTGGNVLRCPFVFPNKIKYYTSDEDDLSYNDDSIVCEAFNQLLADTKSPISSPISSPIAYTDDEIAGDAKLVVGEAAIVAGDASETGDATLVAGGEEGEDEEDDFVLWFSKQRRQRQVLRRHRSVPHLSASPMKGRVHNTATFNSMSKLTAREVMRSPSFTVGCPKLSPKEEAEGLLVTPDRGPYENHFPVAPFPLFAGLTGDLGRLQRTPVRYRWENNCEHRQTYAECASLGETTDPDTTFVSYDDSPLSGEAAAAVARNDCMLVGQMNEKLILSTRGQGRSDQVDVGARRARNTVFNYEPANIEKEKIDSEKLDRTKVSDLPKIAEENCDEVPRERKNPYRIELSSIVEELEEELTVEAARPELQQQQQPKQYEQKKSRRSRTSRLVRRLTLRRGTTRQSITRRPSFLNRCKNRVVELFARPSGSTVEPLPAARRRNNTPVLASDCERTAVSMSDVADTLNEVKKKPNLWKRMSLRRSSRKKREPMIPRNPNNSTLEISSPRSGVDSSFDSCGPSTSGTIIRAHVTPLTDDSIDVSTGGSADYAPPVPDCSPPRSSGFNPDESGVYSTPAAIVPYPVTPNPPKPKRRFNNTLDGMGPGGDGELETIVEEVSPGDPINQRYGGTLNVNSRTVQILNRFRDNHRVLTDNELKFIQRQRRIRMLSRLPDE